MNDETYGRTLLSTLTCENRAFYVHDENGSITVEAFDEPYVVRRLDRIEGELIHGVLAYGLAVELSLNSLRVDPWDRFHGRTKTGVPAVFSRQAQMDFFNFADEFDDDSVTFAGRRYETLPLETAKAPVNKEQFWSGQYDSWQAGAQKPPWELETVAEPLKGVLAQIKIPRSRICVLGSGLGHDAAYFASQGHIVTAVDFSATALAMAREKYPEDRFPELKFVEADAFAYPKAHAGEFDLIFEHTFFCAVDPERRPEVVDAWSRLLAPGGLVLGIFFVIDRSLAPPFGATEWDIREYLKPKFDFLYWTRWRHSIPKRQGRELVVYARKKNGA